MPANRPLPTAILLERLRGLALGPLFVALMPSLSLVAFRLGGEPALTLLALVAATLVALAFGHGAVLGRPGRPRDGVTGLSLRSEAEATLDRLAIDGALSGRRVAVLAIGIDAFERLTGRLGAESGDALLAGAARRILDDLRSDDLAFRLAGPRFGVLLTDLRRADIETLMQISGRLRRELDDPFEINDRPVYLTASIGFCLGHAAPAATGRSVIDAAERALAAAERSGGGAIRSYSSNMRRRDIDRRALQADVETALASGWITAWFQPQLSCDTGTVTGIEAMARWEDPKRGVVLPQDFLASVERARLWAEMGQAVMAEALAALKDWDGAGLEVPRLTIDIARQDLSDPDFADRLRWQLDRADCAPERLGIEVAEAEFGPDRDPVAERTLTAIRRLGCPVLLDEFETGRASFIDFARFGIEGLKIGRSCVARLDTDRDQQSVIAAILAMAERLGVATIATGVETAREHSILAQLGTGHVQGAAVAYPMPAEETRLWLEARRKPSGEMNLPLRPGPRRQGKAGDEGAGKTA